jgi:spermidine/putrescine-binding protein
MGMEVDPERYGLDPEYDYDAVERIALARAHDPGGFTRSDLLKRAGGAAALLALGGPASAFASSRGADSALASGTIDFFSWQGYDIPGVAAPFLKKSRISFNAKYFAKNDDILTAVQQGGGKSPYNLATFTASNGPNLVNLKIAQPIPVSKIPNWNKLYPFLRSGPMTKLWIVNKQNIGVPYTWGGHSMLWDSSVRRSAPTSWTAFLLPEWKNKFVIVDDPTASINMAAHVAGVFNIDMLYTEAKAQRIFDTLALFKKNARTVADYGSLPDLFASGAIEGATAGWAAVANQVAAKGKTTIKAFVPPEGASSFMDVWMTPPSNHPKDGPAVLDFVNFSLSPSAQAYQAKTLAGGVVNPDAVKLLDPSSKSSYPYANLTSFFKRAPVVGRPITAPAGYLTYTDLRNRWNQFKAS